MYIVKNRKIPYEKLFITLHDAKEHCNEKNKETEFLCQVIPAGEHPLPLFEYLLDSYYVEEE